MATNNSWNNQISAAKSQIILNAGTNGVVISNDASAATVDVATGAAAKTVTLGSTNSTSSLALKYGTADFTLASATGTVMSALDTGETTFPLQPAFWAVKSATTTNVTGNGTLYTFVPDTEIYDVNGDYNAGTGVFTAPVTGKYFLISRAVIVGCTIASSIQIQIATSNNTVVSNNNRAASANNYDWQAIVSCDMDSGDTATFKVLTQGEAADTDDIYGDGTVQGAYCNGFLAC